MGFELVNLKTMTEELGGDRTKEILSSFSCPLNQDVEYFLRTKAMPFAGQGWAQTHLVIASYKKEPVIVGYFSLANKSITVSDSAKAKLTNGVRKRLNKFATYEPMTKTMVLSAPLIGQLGKNFSNGYNKLISGAELLQMACDKIKQIQLDLGGKFAYLECEDKPKLIQFYLNNGFIEFDTRRLDPDETSTLDGHYLVQMIRHFK